MKVSADFSKNNLDCLRLILASIVALFHLCILSGTPVFYALGDHLSPHFAIRGFFVISGLLIYRSYTRSSSIKSYFEKRFRRIYPAYFTIIVAAAITLCLLSTLPASLYFGFGFWKYLGANLLFLNFLAPSLPGVFTLNSMPAVNGALWTLKIEVAFYLFVPVMHYLCSRLGVKRVIATTFFLSCVWKFGFAFLGSINHASAIYSIDSSRNFYSQLGSQFPGQLVYFCSGILLFLYLDKLKLHFQSIFFVTAVLFIVGYYFKTENLDVLWIPGVVFVFGFWRYLGNFAKYGDFSYGVYIVHFPIVQTLIACGLLKVNPVLFFATSVLAIAIGSFLMWHLIESRFLSTQSHYRQIIASSSS